MFLPSTSRTKLGPDFQRTWVSVTVSGLGYGMRLSALPLLAAQLSSDPRHVAFVSLAEQLPLLLLGLPAGALADRFDRRRILWVVDAVRALVVGALAAAAAVHAMTIPLLAVVGFLLGLGQTLYNGAWSGMVPALVAPAPTPVCSQAPSSPALSSAPHWARCSLGSLPRFPSLSMRCPALPLPRWP
jgi:MFS family permease